MSVYLIVGIVILAVIMAIAVMIAVYEHKPGVSPMKVWEIAATALANPLKMLALSISFILFLMSVLMSIAVSDSLHLRMTMTGWSDVNISILYILQITGTLATFLMPLFLLAMLDVSAIRRSDFVEEKGKAYSFKVPGITIGTVGLGLVTLLNVLSYMDQITTSVAVSGSFLIICLTAGIASIIYSYNARGATYEEIFAFSMTLVTGVVVYSLDFHWNSLLTYSIPISKLDPDMDPLEFARKVEGFAIDQDNRNFITIAMIIIDLLAAAIGLITQELKNLLKAIVFRTYTNTQMEFNRIERSALDPYSTPSTGTKTRSTTTPTISPVDDDPTSGYTS